MARQRHGRDRRRHLGAGREGLDLGRDQRDQGRLARPGPPGPSAHSGALMRIVGVGEGQRAVGATRPPTWSPWPCEIRMSVTWPGSTPAARSEASSLFCRAHPPPAPGVDQHHPLAVADQQRLDRQVDAVVRVARGRSARPATPGGVGPGTSARAVLARIMSPSFSATACSAPMRKGWTSGLAATAGGRGRVGGLLRRPANRRRRRRSGSGRRRRLAGVDRSSGGSTWDRARPERVSATVSVHGSRPAARAQAVAAANSSLALFQFTTVQKAFR